MKLSVSVSVIVFCTSLIFGQISRKTQNFTRGICQIVRKNSIYSKDINWDSLNIEIDAVSKKADSTGDLSIISEYIIHKLRKLGDNHSRTLSKADFDFAKKANSVFSWPFGYVLENNIAYIYVPGFTSLDKKASENYARSIQNIIKNLDSKNKLDGWIIDLRENAGGNMYPMITGLGPIIGEDILGYFIDSKGEVKENWSYFHGSTHVVKLKNPYVLINTNIKIAVLIGKETISSGEMAAISFIGKPNTKLFGQPSGGYTTGNSVFELKDGSILILAVAYVCDRTKKKYAGKISPDFLVDNDGIFKIVEKWINEK